MDVPEYSAAMREAGFIWHPIAGVWRRHKETDEMWAYEHVFKDGTGWLSHLSGYDSLDTRKLPRFPTPMAALAYAELMNWGRS